jgi:hypothetical protein
MIIKYGSPSRFGGPECRFSGTKELGASDKDIMVNSEALLIGLFSDENIESLGKVEVEPMRGQPCCAFRMRPVGGLHTFFALQVLGCSHQMLLVGCPHLGVASRVASQQHCCQAQRRIKARS